MWPRALPRAAGLPLFLGEKVCAACRVHPGYRKLVVNLNVKGAIPAAYSKLTKLTTLDLSEK